MIDVFYELYRILEEETVRARRLSSKSVSKTKTFSGQPTMSAKTLQEIAMKAAERVNPERYLATLQDLIRIPSLSGEEADVAQYVARRIREVGLDGVEVDKHNTVIGTLGRGSHRLLIICHTDTMKPAPGMEEPYVPKIRDLNGEPTLYGAGAATPKSGIAGMIEAMYALKQIEDEIPSVIFVANSRDLHPTEHGIGDVFIDHDIKADGVINGEPTRLRVGIGARGYSLVEMLFTGAPHHAGRPDQKRNPISAAAEFLHNVLQKPMLSNPLLGSAAMTPLEWSSEGQRPHTPKYARVLLDRRLLPEDEPIETIRDQFVALGQAFSDEVQVEGHIRRHQYPWIVDPNEPVVQAVGQAVKLVTGTDPDYFALSHSSGCGHIKKVTGITPVAFAGGDIADIGSNDHVMLSRAVIAARTLAAAIVLFGKDR